MLRKSLDLIQGHFRKYQLGNAYHLIYEMRMEKKNDRRWRQRIRRDVVTSRAPNPPYKCAECPRHILSLQFVAVISLCGLHDPLVHENKGNPQKSQNVSISFAPYLRSTI